ncbi:MAG: hypothetical protein ACOCX5_04990 [Chloroflexota bacterium]
MLGEAILDEIYYRILREDRSGALRAVLQRQAQIQQIACAVDYIHQCMDQTISVEALAKMVNMSATTFHRRFKEVMHLPPLQYANQLDRIVHRHSSEKANEQTKRVTWSVTTALPSSVGNTNDTLVMRDQLHRHRDVKMNGWHYNPPVHFHSVH